MAFLRSIGVPSQTEIKLRLGDELSQRLFETADPSLQSLMGVKPYLNGPPDEMWVSPSDLLIGYVRLTPPLTSKHIQALTHEGILQIGQDVENKFIRQMEGKRILALKSNIERLKYIAEKEKEKAIRKTTKELEEKFEAELELIYSAFEEKLKDELNKQKVQLLEEQDMEVLRGKLAMKKLMQNKVDEVVKVTVSKLIEEYAKVLEQQSQKWHEHFKYHVKQAEEHLEKSIEKEKDKCSEQMREMYSDLQCDFISNMMYTICAERRKCQCEKNELENKLTDTILQLEGKLRDTNLKLDEVTASSVEKDSKIKCREETLYMIIKEFQKFIYFALKSEPQQAEYLLDIEKLMIFELTKSVMDLQPQMFEGSSLLDLTRRSSETSERTSSSSKTVETHELLVIKDYHNCDNKERVPSSNQTLDSSVDLPGFVYDHNIFVREDFRNMISQGLRISKSNENWNWDVDDLEKLLTKDHGLCMKSSSMEKFPCLADPCTSACPQKYTKEALKRTFYETCLGPCEKEEDTIPPLDDTVCDMSCVKQLITLPCDFSCPLDEEQRKIVDRKHASEPKLVAIKPFVDVHVGSCKSCNLLNLGNETLKGTETTCDCFPTVANASLSKVTQSFVMEAHRVASDLEIPRKFDNPDPAQVKHIPIHFAKNSQEILRKKTVEMKMSHDYENKEEQKRTNVVERVVTLGKSRKDSTIMPIRVPSRIGEARDSIELAKKSSSCLRVAKWSAPDSLSTVSGFPSFEKFTVYLDKIHPKIQANSFADKTAKLSRFQALPIPKNKSGIIFRDGLPKTTPKRWSTATEGSVRYFPKADSKILGPHVDDRIGNFIKNFSSDSNLRQLFLGTR